MPSKRRDPHAHAVHVPGPRLLRTTPLRFFQQGRRRRGNLVSLSAVSLIDVLVVLVLFLIAQPQTATGCGCLHHTVKVPFAANGEDLIDAPVVSVVGGLVLVDGVSAGSTREIAQTGRVERIDELRGLLAGKRALWKRVTPHKPFPGACILEITGEVPAIVVKSVFRSVVEAGYPNVSFMVRRLDAP